MTLILTDTPLAEPVTIVELKEQLRLDHNNEDVLLASLITVARQHLESITDLALIDQSWRLCIDSWPHDNCLLINKYPIKSIDLIEQYDADGIAQTVDQSAMVLDGKSHPARLYVGPQTEPQQAINGIEISFIAGFGASTDVPDLIKRAILLHACHLYEFRAIVPDSMQPASTPTNYNTLISPWLKRKL